jgi:hypothetical protein
MREKNLVALFLFDDGIAMYSTVFREKKKKTF